MSSISLSNDFSNVSSQLSSAPGLKRKVKKVLEQRIDSPELCVSLKTLSLLCPEATPSRRALKAVVEKRGVELNDQFLAEAEQVLSALATIETQLAPLPDCCQRVSEAVAASRSTTGAVLEAAERQQRAIEEVERKRRVASAFLTKYKLTDEETATLQAGEIDEAFFAALQKATEVHAACKELLRRGRPAAATALKDELLAGVSPAPATGDAAAKRRRDGESDGDGEAQRSHHSRAALELLDLATSAQEGAFEWLCRWVQKQCRSACAKDPAGGGAEMGGAAFDLGDVDQLGSTAVSSHLWRAVAALQQRPVLFKYCCEEVVAARQTLKFQSFVTALTHGGGPGHSRPIAIHAHEPVRYVNDMLAWVHQALAAEREFLYNLLAPKEGSDGVSEGSPSSRSGSFWSNSIPTTAEGGGAGSSPAPPLDAEVRDLLDQIFESVCRPLRMRIEQVILSQIPIPLAIQLTQLLSFYLFTMAKVLDEHSQLLAVVRACRDAARTAFFDELRARGGRMGTGLPQISPEDLSPPPQVLETVHQLLEILEAYETSLAAPLCLRGGGADDGEREREGEGEGESTLGGQAGGAAGEGRATSDTASASAFSSIAVTTRTPAMAAEADMDSELSRVVSLMLDPVTDLCRRAADLIAAPNKSLEAHRRHLRKLTQTLLPAAPLPRAGAHNVPAAAIANAREQEAADASSALSSTRLVFLANCYDALWSSLFQSRPVLARTRAAQAIKSALHASVEALVVLEAGQLLRACQLAEVSERLQLYRDFSGGREIAGKTTRTAEAEDGLDLNLGDEGADVLSPPSRDPALSASRVTAVLRALFILVSTPNAIPEFRQIQAPRVRSSAASQVCRRLVDSYAEVVAAFEDQANGYAAAAAAAAAIRAAAPDQSSVPAPEPTYRYASVAQIRAVLGVVL